MITYRFIVENGNILQLQNNCSQIHVIKMNIHKKLNEHENNIK